MLVKRINGQYYPSFFDAIFNDENIEKKSNSFTRPSYNIYEDENGFVIDLAAPGLKKEGFKLEVKNDTLELLYEIEVKEEVNEPKYFYKGFSYGDFKRYFSLPENVDKENISANYENGILKVLIPKDKEAKTSRQITVS